MRFWILSKSHIYLRYLIILALFALLLVVWAFCLHYPLINYMDFYKSKIISFNKLKKSYLRINYQNSQLKIQINKLCKEISSNFNKIKQDNLDNSLSTIIDNVYKNSLTLVYCKPGSTKKTVNSKIYKKSFELLIEGYFYNILKFLRALKSSEIFIDCFKYNFEKNETGQLKFKFMINLLESHEK